MTLRTMKGRTNLKLVESHHFERREGALWGEQSVTNALHQSFHLPNQTHSELISYFIEQYSEKGDIVLDPFCGTGSVGLEALMSGRTALLSDRHPFAIKIAKAKIQPFDLSEVTLRLQLVNVRRPINIAQFTETFRPFYDLDTFRELLNLKVYLQEQKDPISRFIELLTLDLLHGHTAGYFSVYTSPLVSLSPEEQTALNFKRGNVPDYRAVIPRILRKAATILRDGIPSALTNGALRSKVTQSDARDLGYIPASSVDLVMTTPPQPGITDPFNNVWLKSWFVGFPSQFPADRSTESLEEWGDFMNEALLELARVTKRSGRLVLNLRDVNHNKEVVALDEILLENVQSNLNKFWEAEALYINRPKSVQLKNKERDRDAVGTANRVLVLRRR